MVLATPSNSLMLFQRCVLMFFVLAPLALPSGKALAGCWRPLCDALPLHATEITDVVGGLWFYCRQLHEALHPSELSSFEVCFKGLICFKGLVELFVTSDGWLLILNMLCGFSCFLCRNVKTTLRFGPKPQTFLAAQHLSLSTSWYAPQNVVPYVNCMACHQRCPIYISVVVTEDANSIFLLVVSQSQHLSLNHGGLLLWHAFNP